MMRLSWSSLLCSSLAVVVWKMASGSWPWEPQQSDPPAGVVRARASCSGVRRRARARK